MSASSTEMRVAVWRVLWKSRRRGADAQDRPDEQASAHASVFLRATLPPPAAPPFRGRTTRHARRRNQAV